MHMGVALYYVRIVCVYEMRIRETFASVLSFNEL